MRTLFDSGSGEAASEGAKRPSHPLSPTGTMRGRLETTAETRVNP